MGEDGGRGHHSNSAWRRCRTGRGRWTRRVASWWFTTPANGKWCRWMKKSKGPRCILPADHPPHCVQADHGATWTQGRNPGFTMDRTLGCGKTRWPVRTQVTRYRSSSPHRCGTPKPRVKRHGNAVERCLGCHPPRIRARQRRATKTLDAPPSEAMCGVMAIVATCRLMAAVWHDRLVSLADSPGCAAKRGDPGLRSTTAMR